MTFFRSHLQTCPVIAILRGLSPTAAEKAARSFWALGIDLVEVTVQDDNGLRALEAVAASAATEGRQIGAGSVTSIADLERVLSLGASFAISPGLDLGLVELAKNRNIPYLPAVATPTEIQAAQAHGVRDLKLFPARELGGVEFLTAMAGPFPRVSFVPTGGVTVHTIDSYLDAGALGVGLGGEVTTPDGAEALSLWLRNKPRASQ